MVDTFMSHQAEKGLDYPTGRCCRIFGVSRSGFYSWKRKREQLEEKKSAEAIEDQKLMEMFRDVVKKLCYVPGKRTFRTFLWRDYGISISVKKCRRIMSMMHLVANRPKKDAYKNRATHDHETTAPDDQVKQDFKVAPRQVILTDITYLYYGLMRELFYLCVFKDAYTTEVLGAAVSRNMGVTLVKEAYDCMMREHGSELHEPGILIHHDQGSQYLSTTFRQILSDDGFIQSCSRRGNSQDNAPMESFFGSMKCHIMDLIALCTTYESASKLVMKYIQDYNTKHYRYELAGLTPAEYYIYVTTGIYPCDDYYGVKPNEMTTVGELVRKRMEYAAEKEAKERKRRAEKRAHRDDGEIHGTALGRVAGDRLQVLRLISKYRGILIEANAWIEKNREDIRYSEKALDDLKKTLIHIEEAEEFMKTLTASELQDRKKKENWDRYPELNYRYEMAGLFDNDPLRRFHEENGWIFGRKQQSNAA